MIQVPSRGVASQLLYHRWPYFARRTSYRNPAVGRPQRTRVVVQIIVSSFCLPQPMSVINSYIPQSISISQSIFLTLSFSLSLSFLLIQKSLFQPASPALVVVVGLREVKDHEDEGENRKHRAHQVREQERVPFVTRAGLRWLALQLRFTGDNTDRQSGAEPSSLRASDTHTCMGSICFVSLVCEQWQEAAITGPTTQLPGRKRNTLRASSSKQ